MHIILQVTQQGTRPPPLPDCPPPLAQLMQRCWEEEPADRQVGSAGPKVSILLQHQVREFYPCVDSDSNPPCVPAPPAGRPLSAFYRSFRSSWRPSARHASCSSSRASAPLLPATSRG